MNIGDSFLIFIKELEIETLILREILSVVLSEMPVIVLTT